MSRSALLLLLMLVAAIGPARGSSEDSSDENRLDVRPGRPDKDSEWPGCRFRGNRCVCRPRSRHCLLHPRAPRCRCKNREKGSSSDENSSEDSSRSREEDSHCNDCRFEGMSYRPGDVIERNADKCFTVLCEAADYPDDSPSVVIEEVQNATSSGCCELNDTLYPSGHSYTENNVTMVIRTTCNNGSWTNKPDGCEYNGKQYDSGDVIERNASYCFTLLCKAAHDPDESPSVVIEEVGNATTGCCELNDELVPSGSQNNENGETCNNGSWTNNTGRCESNGELYPSGYSNTEYGVQSICGEDGEWTYKTEESNDLRMITVKFMEMKRSVRWRIKLPEDYEDLQRTYDADAILAIITVKTRNDTGYNITFYGDNFGYKFYDSRNGTTSTEEYKYLKIGVYVQYTMTISDGGNVQLSNGNNLNISLTHEPAFPEGLVVGIERAAFGIRLYPGNNPFNFTTPSLYWQIPGSSEPTDGPYTG